MRTRLRGSAWAISIRSKGARSQLLLRQRVEEEAVVESRIVRVDSAFPETESPLDTFTEFFGARCFPDHSIFLRSDIRGSRRAKIEDNGTVNILWRFGQVPVNQSAHIFGE